MAGLEFHPKDSGFLIQVTCAEPHQVQISRDFTAGLSAELRSNWKTLRSSCLPDAPRQVTTRLWPDVADVVVQLCTSFVVFHELFHVLNGHTAHALTTSVGKPKDLALVEAAQRVSRTRDAAAAGTRDTDQAILEAYYLELEADNTALQWLMQASPLSKALRRVVELTTGEPAAGEIAAQPGGWGRVLAFRVLLAALVVTVRLLERQRGDDTREPTSTHPYPMARLFAGVFTVMEQFAEIVDHEIDEDGSKSAVLTAEQADDLKTFLLMVVKPIVAARWSTRDAAAADDGFEVQGPLMAIEIENIMFGRPVVTEPVRQMQRVQRLRTAMIGRLAPLCCIERSSAAPQPPAQAQPMRPD